MTTKQINLNTAVSVLILALFSLSACQTYQTYDVKISPTFSANTQPDENQGIVVARIVNAGSIPLPINRITFTPKNLNESDYAQLTEAEALTTTPGKTAIFASTIDEGEYSLRNVKADHFNRGTWYRRHVDTDIDLGTFEVKPGVITDLGTLIYYSKLSDGVYSEAIIRSPNPPDGSIVNSTLPILKYQEREVIGWKQDGLDESRNTVYRTILQNPTQLTREYRAPDDSLFLLSKLGLIIKRSHSGEWSLEAVDTDFELYTIAVNIHGDIAVGGEFGNIYFKRREGSWRRIEIDRKYTVKEIIFQNENEINIALISSDRLDYSSINLLEDNPTPKIIQSYKYHIGWLPYDQTPTETSSFHSDRKPWLIDDVELLKFEGRDYMYLSAQSGNSFSIDNWDKSKIQRVNTRTWGLSAPGDHINKMDYLVNAGAIDLGKSWDSARGTSYHRFDEKKQDWINTARRIDQCASLEQGQLRCKINGQVVVRYKKFSFVTTPVFFSEKEGLAIVYLTDKKEDEKIVVAHTTDGGLTWLDKGYKVPKDYCLKILPQVFESLLVSCSGATSDIYESKDKGASWEHVREQENF